MGALVTSNPLSHKRCLLTLLITKFIEQKRKILVCMYEALEVTHMNVFTFNYEPRTTESISSLARNKN